MSWHQIAQYLVMVGIAFRGICALSRVLAGRPAIVPAVLPVEGALIVIALSALSAFIAYSAGAFT